MWMQKHILDENYLEIGLVVIKMQFVGKKIVASVVKYRWNRNAKNNYDSFSE